MRPPASRCLAVLLAALLGAVPASHAAEVAGPARIIDGDTLDVAGTRVRLWGIDAPEMGQTCTRDGKAYPCGELARLALEALVGGRPVTCAAKDRDRNGRVVALYRVEGADLGAMLVTVGLALDYTRTSKGFYRDHEAAAKARKVGLWTGTFAPPWEHRRERFGR